MSAIATETMSHPISTCIECGIDIKPGNNLRCMYCHIPQERAAKTERTRKLYFQHLMLTPRHGDKADKWEFLTGDVDITYGAIWYQDNGDDCDLVVIDELPEPTGAVQLSDGMMGFWSSNINDSWDKLKQIIGSYASDWEDFWSGYNANARRQIMWQALNAYWGYDPGDRQSYILVYDRESWDGEDNKETRDYNTAHSQQYVIYVDGVEGLEDWLYENRGINCYRRTQRLEREQDALTAMVTN